MNPKAYQWIVVSLAVLGLLVPVSVMSAQVSRMTVQELATKIDNDEVVVLDVRAGRDWRSSEFKIKGARRAEPGKLDSWIATYPKDNTLVLYCA